MDSQQNLIKFNMKRTQVHTNLSNIADARVETASWSFTKKKETIFSGPHEVVRTGFLNAEEVKVYLGNAAGNPYTSASSYCCKDQTTERLTGGLETTSDEHSEMFQW